MGGQVVHDDNVALFEGGCELLLDIDLEDVPVHGRIDNERGGEPVAAQSRHEGLRQPMAEGGFRSQPLTFGAATAQARQLGRCPCLVEKDEPMWLKPHPRLALIDKGLARFFDVWPVLLACQQSFF